MRFYRARERRGLHCRGRLLETAPRWCGRLAQLVEQLTLNQRAVGSNPTAPTNEYHRHPAIEISLAKGWLRRWLFADRTECGKNLPRSRLEHGGRKVSVRSRTHRDSRRNRRCLVPLEPPSVAPEGGAYDDNSLDHAGFGSGAEIIRHGNNSPMRLMGCPSATALAAST